MVFDPSNFVIRKSYSQKQPVLRLVQSEYTSLSPQETRSKTSQRDFRRRTDVRVDLRTYPFSSEGSSRSNNCLKPTPGVTEQPTADPFVRGQNLRRVSRDGTPGGREAFSTSVYRLTKKFRSFPRGERSMSQDVLFYIGALTTTL